MDVQKEIRVTPSEVREMLAGSGETICIEDDFVIGRRLRGTDVSQLAYPFKIDSFLTAFCTAGNICCSINLQEYTLEPGMLLVVTPGNIVRLSVPDGKDFSDCRFTILNVSEKFFSSMGFNHSDVIMEAMTVLRSPCIDLSDDEISLLSKYVDIVYELIRSGSEYMQESVKAALLSIFYQFAGFLHRSMDISSQLPVKSTRQRTMFEQFMKLAAENHRNCRTMKFYADRLCVTPKYLSKVIKDVSGKSGPQWLDEFVILSSKNLLRHSSLTIKEIASILNFPSQTFFFRFFKNGTGQTPNQYRLS